MSNHRDRIVDEMAILLCDLPNLHDETSCILVLMGHGYRGAEVNDNIDEARMLAQAARDTWVNHDRRRA